MPHPAPPPPASDDVRRAGADRLSLALMDARNQTLALLARWGESSLSVPCQLGLERIEWLAGHVGWFAEWWIGRNPRRGLGRRCPPDAPRLPSVLPMADRWYHPLQAPHASRWDMPLPDLGEVRGYLLETFESTLDLLERTAADDEALYFFRAALVHEDLRGEQLVRQAQGLGLALPIPLPVAAAMREPLSLPATRWTLGTEGSTFSFDVERGHEEVDVPEFEIDAQPVTWGQYVEFVADGGYDRAELWHPQGWAWLQAQPEGRRAPRYVDQIAVGSGAVLQAHFGRPTRMASQQPVLHVCWWEADAWTRWAGRRLPTEVEWEVAATRAGSRGFRWGDVHEWTAGTLRPWTGYSPDPWTRHGDFDAEPLFGQARVLRGAPYISRPRLRWPQRRGFALPGRDDLFTGFRSCAV
ncbi:SUMF1/EgtB/PvdO family nonheme iron enzyme [Ramlibacter algicola]|uniref:Ergothioneine biosynthesis protein EgtB n=1 Tax=Ramlibacter algicola TaxID=2795217 RepID=A0A934UT56_9BURK|nr:SUMF1/EgtB/PvdO family nonheme iron enzyme [Ramlibacter algicola]MBK0394192.1 ergothioneine biosynthesis protein EgtB [Ramlibacter algicola]